MKLMTMKQYMKMSTTALIRKINKELRVMPKVKLARLCYNLTKAKLPRLSIRKRAYELKSPWVKGSSRDIRRMELYEQQHKTKRKTKRKFSRKQLAAQRLFAKRARAGTLRKRRR